MIARLAACLMVLAAPLPALAQQAPVEVHSQRPPPPQMSGDRADLPMELTAGLPTILATVNGRGPYRFGVDTGAGGYLHITPALAQTLHLEPVGEALAGDPSGRNPVRVALYQVQSLGFGGLRFSRVTATAFSVTSPRLAGLDGIIGIGFFDHLLLTLDYGRLRFTAAPGALPAANGRDVVDFTLDHGVLITFPLGIGGATHQIHLDTGNIRYPLFMPADAIAALPTQGNVREIGVAHTVSQTLTMQAIDLAAPVTVGTTRLPVTAVGYPAFSPIGNLGSLALATMAVTIDRENHRLRIVPSLPR